MDENQQQDRAVTSYRAVELGTAVAAFVFGAIVAFDSYRIGAGWADDGPQAGYFPFYVAVIICAASAWVFFTTWRRKDVGTEAFVLRGQMKQILALLVPAIGYVIAIEFVGIYVASFVFIAYFMARHGGHRLWVTAAVSIGLPLVLFMMFERWFKTPLPKGPLEALLGLN